MNNRLLKPNSHSSGWTLNNLSYVQSFSLSGISTGFGGLTFSADGTKLYCVSATGDKVYQLNLSAAWDISTASYSSQNMSIASQLSGGSAVSFKPDGSLCYVTGNAAEINQYNVTSWDISTGAYSKVKLITGSTYMYGHFINPDGTKLFCVGPSNDLILTWNFGTAWDIATLGSATSISIAAYDGESRGIFFNPDGTKMFLTGQTNDKIFEFSLSTAWDLTTINFIQSVSIVTQDTYSAQLYIRNDGLKLYMLGSGNNQVHEYNL